MSFYCTLYKLYKVLYPDPTEYSYYFSRSSRGAASRRRRRCPMSTIGVAKRADAIPLRLTPTERSVLRVLDGAASG